MGNKPSTEFETAAGMTTEQMRKQNPKGFIKWGHVKDLHIGSKYHPSIVLTGGEQTIEGLTQRPEGLYNQKNYKLYFYQSNKPEIILGINTIRDLLSKQKITRDDLPINDKLFNKIIQGVATNDDLVPTLQQIAEMEYKNIATIRADNPNIQEGGKRKKTRRHIKRKRSKTRKH